MYSYVAWEMLWNAIRCIAIAILYSICLGYTQKKLPAVLIGSICLAVYTSAIYQLNIPATMEIVEGVVLYTEHFFYSAGSVVYCIAAFRGSESKKIMWGLVPELAAAFASFAAVPITTALRPAPAVQITSLSDVRAVFIVVQSLLMLALFLVLILLHRGKKRRRPQTPMYIDIGLITILLLGIVVVDQLMDYYFDYDTISFQAHQNRFFLVAGCFCIIITLVFLLIQRLGVLSQTNTEYAIRIQNSKEQKMLYTTLEKSFQVVRKEKHDVRNHLQTMRGLLSEKKYDELSGYFEEMNVEYKKTDAVYTDNMAINIMLSSKFAIAAEKGIDCSYKIEDLKPLQERYTDLCSLLGNLLDNAIEACDRMQEQSEKYIRLEMRLRDEMIFLSVENSTNGEYVQDDNNGLASSKEGVMHGAGFLIITDIVGGNGGHIDVSALPDTFIVKIILPSRNFVKVEGEKD